MKYKPQVLKLLLGLTDIKLLYQIAIKVYKCSLLGFVTCLVGTRGKQSLPATGLQTPPCSGTASLGRAGAAEAGEALWLGTLTGGRRDKDQFPVPGRNHCLRHCEM